MAFLNELQLPWYQYVFKDGKMTNQWCPSETCKVTWGLLICWRMMVSGLCRMKVVIPHVTAKHGAFTLRRNTSRWVIAWNGNRQIRRITVSETNRQRQVWCTCFHWLWILADTVGGVVESFELVHQSFVPPAKPGKLGIDKGHESWRGMVDGYPITRIWSWNYVVQHRMGFCVSKLAGLTCWPKGTN